MKTINNVLRWGDEHHPVWLVVFRVLLGVILFQKGLQFSRNPLELKGMTNDYDFGLLSLFLLHYVPMVHLGGGVLIVFGFLTRVSILFQLPILIGAVLFTGRSTGFFDLYSEFGLALLTLSLLIIFLVIGSGRISIDKILR